MTSVEERERLIQLVDAGYRIARELEAMRVNLQRLHAEATDIMRGVAELLNMDATPRANTDHEDTSPGIRR